MREGFADAARIQVPPDTYWNCRGSDVQLAVHEALLADLTNRDAEEASSHTLAALFRVCHRPLSSCRASTRRRTSSRPFSVME